MIWTHRIVLPDPRYPFPNSIYVKKSKDADTSRHYVPATTCYRLNVDGKLDPKGNICSRCQGWMGPMAAYCENCGAGIGVD